MPRGRDEMQVNVAGLRRNIKNLAHNYSDAQVKVREATSNDPWGPSSTLMAEIADLTYNVMAFTEIMQMIWKRLNDHGKNWRHVYKALVLMEYLIKTGSEKVAMQCKENIYAIHTLKDFQYMEEGKDQGLNVREKAKQLVNLLKDEERLKNERARALKAKQRFAQSASAFGSDGALDTPSSPTYPPSEGSGSGWTAGAAELARPLTAGEEELQLQLALAMSREEAERDERRRRSDDVRLQLAISQSQNDFQIQEYIRQEYLRQEFLKLPPIIEQSYTCNQNYNDSCQNYDTMYNNDEVCQNVNCLCRDSDVPYDIFDNIQSDDGNIFKNLVPTKQNSVNCQNDMDCQESVKDNENNYRFEAFQMSSKIHQSNTNPYTVTNDVKSINFNTNPGELNNNVPYLNTNPNELYNNIPSLNANDDRNNIPSLNDSNVSEMTAFDSDDIDSVCQEDVKDWQSTGTFNKLQNFFGFDSTDYSFWMCGGCFQCLQNVQANPVEKKPETNQSHLLDLLDVNLGPSPAPVAASSLDPWGVPAPVAQSTQDTSADAWSGVGSPPREPWAAADPWAPTQLQLQSKSPVSALSSPSSGELEQFDALSQRKNNNNPEPDPFDLSVLGDPLPAPPAASAGAMKKSPSQFLGENSSLVNLERLLAAPPAPAAAHNPFADAQRAFVPPQPAKLTINELKQQQMGLSGLQFGSPVAGGAVGGVGVTGATPAPDPWAPAPAPRTSSPWSPQNQRHTPNPFLS